MSRLISHAILPLLAMASPWFFPVGTCLLQADQTKGKAGFKVPWSFAPVTKPDPPAPGSSDQAWPRDDLDRFILARIIAAGLKPNQDADRTTLLRRISFDLTGLPPDEKRIAAFVSDPASDDQAIARVVDGYLASPQFGERWARHWLDVVRYADSSGRTWNTPYTYAWRYRNYVIDAFNADKPYDRFVAEQIAGDLLPAKTLQEKRDNLTAPGVLAMGALDLQTLSEDQFTLDVVDDQIDVVSRAMLGLTLSCARCHDHKYDPVSMRDYYALAGIFYSSRILPGASYRGRGNGYLDHQQLAILPVSKGGKMVTPPVSQGVHSMGDYQRIWSTGNQRNIRFSTDPNLAMSLSEGEIGDCAIRIKGDPNDTGDTPPRGDLKIPGLPSMARPAATASGRLELARWITSPQNPLTARVMVNRIWLHLLGQGLVETPDDFGAAGQPPTHPELLDHLAGRFVSGGWSIKKLIRSIMLSRTYRLGSRTRDNPADDADPQNTLYWRANLRRLEFEPLRDSLLAAAGLLRADRPEGVQVSGIGGKSIKSQVNSLLSIHDPYRSVYLPVIRSRLADAFSIFDFPDPCQISGKREVTTVAPQALFFMNSAFVAECAAETVALMQKQAPAGDAARVDWLYRRLLGRPANSRDRADAAHLLGGGDADRWAIFVQGLMCTAEFRYVR